MSMQRSHPDEQYYQSRPAVDSGRHLKLIAKTVFYGVVAVVLAIGLVLNLLIPDAVLVIDELLLAAGVLVFGNLARRTRTLTH